MNALFRPLSLTEKLFVAIFAAMVALTVMFYAVNVVLFPAGHAAPAVVTPAQHPVRKHNNNAMPTWERARLCVPYTHAFVMHTASSTYSHTIELRHGTGCFGGFAIVTHESDSNDDVVVVVPSATPKPTDTPAPKPTKAHKDCGVGNGVDGDTKGCPDGRNDGTGTEPGNPGSKGGNGNNDNHGHATPAPVTSTGVGLFILSVYAYFKRYGWIFVGTGLDVACAYRDAGADVQVETFSVGKPHCLASEKGQGLIEYAIFTVMALIAIGFALGGFGK